MPFASSGGTIFIQNVSNNGSGEYSDLSTTTIYKMKATIGTIIITFLIIYSQSTWGQSIISSDGKYGLTDAEGKIVVTPQYDSIYNPSDKSWGKGKGLKFFVLVDGEKYGYIIRTLSKDTNLQWIAVDIEFDNIKYIEGNDVSPDFAILKKGNKYGFLAIYAFYRQNYVQYTYSTIGIDHVFSSEIVYDSIWGKTLKKDGKYGKYLSWEAIIDPVYDTLEYIGESKEWRSHFGLSSHKGYYSVVKDSLYGILLEDSLVIPIKYKKGQIVKDGWDQFIISSEEGGTRWLSIKQGFDVTILSNGKPFKPSPTRLYKYLELESADAKDRILVVKHEQYWSESPYEKGSREDLLYSLGDHFIVINPISGETIKEYNKAGCRYILFQQKFIIQFKAVQGSKEKIERTIFELGTGRALDQTTSKYLWKKMDGINEHNQVAWYSTR
ncbi:MAG: hypothetical protein JKY52_07025 [Flavobacteriales bacterium]|nr:hypothetical protein [Flavobacteriales bacterium]